MSNSRSSQSPSPPPTSLPSRRLCLFSQEVIVKREMEDHFTFFSPVVVFSPDMAADAANLKVSLPDLRSAGQTAKAIVDANMNAQADLPKINLHQRAAASPWPSNNTLYCRMAEDSQQQRRPGDDPVDFGGKKSDSSSSSEDESPNSSDAEGKSSKKRKHESEEEKRARKKAKKERKRERKEKRRERRPHHFTDLDLIGEAGALDRGMGTPASGTLPRLGGSIV